MSLVAIAVVLGLLIVLFMKAKWVRPVPGMVCVLFGVLLAAGPAGPPLQNFVLDAGAWVDRSLGSL
jgi:hypothetical protein